MEAGAGFAGRCRLNRRNAPVVTSKSTLLSSGLAITRISLAIDLRLWSLMQIAARLSRRIRCTNKGLLAQSAFYGCLRLSTIRLSAL